MAFVPSWIRNVYMICPSFIKGAGFFSTPRLFLFEAYGLAFVIENLKSWFQESVLTCDLNEDTILCLGSESVRMGFGCSRKNTSGCAAKCYLFSARDRLLRCECFDLLLR